MVDTRSSTREEESQLRVRKLLDAYESVKINQMLEDGVKLVTGMPSAVTVYRHPSFFKIFPILYQRGLKNLFRQPTLAISRISQVNSIK